VAVRSVEGVGVAHKLARIASPKTATVVGGATLLPWVAGVPLAIATSHHIGGDLFAVFAVFALMVPFGVVGLLIGRRQPTNPIGWIMLAVVGAITVSTSASSYAVLAFRMGHPGLPLARLAVALTQCWILLPLLLPLPVLLFPTGRVPSRRWRATLWVYLAVCVTVLLGFASKDVAAFTDKTVHVDSSGELVTLGSGKTSPVVPVLLVVFALISLSWVVRQIVAYRRATGDLRAAEMADERRGDRGHRVRAGGAARQLLKRDCKRTVPSWVSRRYRRCADCSGRRRLEVPAVRHRPHRQPHRRLCSRHRTAHRCLRCNDRADHTCDPAIVIGGCRRIDTGRRGVVHPAAPPGPTTGRPTIQQG
jgi:hypothetical protein